jgi:serine/threonine protein kinase
MGEIYLARTRGAGGFQKKVVIKRLLPYLSSEREFVQKFIDEANIVTHLTHGNIVPVFDMGEAEGELYIAMEYIPGRDLRDVLQRCAERGVLLSLKAAIFVGAELCKGLGYAHRKVDEAGQPLGIIHRDISPSNVLLSDEGEVKVVDFGIAKAAGRLSKSSTGRLQGKFRYMSPEQAAGKALDARSDIFSAGVVLYELLTGVKPFEGERDLESLELVRTYHPPPPSSYRAEVPEAIDAVVMRALEKDVAKRYGRVEELERALLTWLFAHGGATSREVADELGEFFPEGIERPEVRFPTVTGESAPRVSLDDAMALEVERLLAGRSLDGRTPSEGRTPSDARTPSVPRVSVGFQDTATASPSGLTPQVGALPASERATPPSTPPVGRLSGTVSMVGPAVPAPSLVSQGLSLREDGQVRIGGQAISEEEAHSLGRSSTMPMEAVGRSPSGPTPAVVSPHTPSASLALEVTPAVGPTVAQPVEGASEVTPAFASAPKKVAELPAVVVPEGRGAEGVAAEPGRRSRLWVFVGVVLVLLLGAVGLLVREVFFGAPLLIVTATPMDARIWVDGAPAGGSPAQLERLEPGEHRVRVERDGYEPQEQRVVLQAGQTVPLQVSLQPHQEQAQVREVWFESEPPGATLFLDNVRTEHKTPALVRVPLGGAVVTLVSADGSQKVFNLQAGDTQGRYLHRFVAPGPPVEEPDAGPSGPPDAASVPSETDAGERPEELRPVQVSSEPVGAQVFVGRALKGKTPARVEVPVGGATVTLKLDGHEPFVEFVRPEQRPKLAAKLKPLPAPVEVKPPVEDGPKVEVPLAAFCKPAGRSVPVVFVIDGKEHRPPGGVLRVSLSLGKHSISVRPQASDLACSYAGSLVVEESMRGQTQPKVLTMTGPEP